jgi:hypothetical protein
MIGTVGFCSAAGTVSTRPAATTAAITATSLRQFENEPDRFVREIPAGKAFGEKLVSIK